MKNTIFALLKFNVIAFAVLFAVAIIINDNYKRQPDGLIPGFMLLGIIVWNIKIILNRRKEIVSSVTDKVIDVAAASIELKDAASVRIQERIKERQNQK
ncbi:MULTISPECIES: hypothetical protein [unclassified Undibacterium]|uniref:hypothetical protein n=1 Tax=unclassified Undibacterium TaxID=2630295 RepID=UPI00164BAB91|nr:MULTISPECIES: hypothetical protein [unclassified Undibacterium]MBC3876233.1 hypothetical protein [Undibacterium sp. FT79W]MBC3928091.1 hypothetical protein [Undibacterium sp. CY21W]